jgi:hypothetical protein
MALVDIEEKLERQTEPEMPWCWLFGTPEASYPSHRGSSHRRKHRRSGKLGGRMILYRNDYRFYQLELFDQSILIVFMSSNKHSCSGSQE